MQPLDMIKRWWLEAAPVARAGILVGLAAMVFSLGYYGLTASSNRPVPLFVGMSSADASRLGEELRSRKIPFELKDNGTTVAVRLPPDEMRKLRLELTSEGLPVGKVTGWDIFDDSSVTLTEFERKVMYQRALQGELSRTIAELPQVRTARVHLALPSRSLLERDASDPTASVYISLEPGRNVGSRVASGIAYLVASSVPDLVADRITIMDGNGTVIREPDDGAGSMGRKVLELKETRERTYEKDIVELLQRTVGRGHVIAKVAVDMDLSRVEETLEQYDPDNATLKSRRKTSEQTNSERSQPTAVAGVQGNLPQAPEDAQANNRGTKSSSNRSIDSEEYKVPRTVRQVSKPLGEIRKLSIAVLIDANPFEVAPKPGDAGAEGADGDEGLEVPEGVEGSKGAMAGAPRARPSPEMLASLVKNAVGFDETRGDRVEISFVPFVVPDTVGGDEVQYIESPLEIWLWVLITFLVGTALVAGSLWVTERRRKQAAIEEYAAQLREKEALLQKQKDDEEEGGIPDTTRLRQEVRELTARNVAATVEVMKGWLRPTLGKS